MFETTATYLLPLTVSILVNILLGVYNNVKVQSITFDWHILVNGIIKAFIIAASALGLAYCFDVTTIGELGVSPELIMNAAIILYVGKGCSNLASILGVDLTKMKNVNSGTHYEEDDI